MQKTSTANGNIYSQNTSLINFHGSADTNFYRGEKIYSESILEISPLNRIKQQKQEGNAWFLKPIIYRYESSTSSDVVKKYEIFTTWDPINKIFVNSIPSISTYQANVLYKDVVVNEDGNETIIF